MNGQTKFLAGLLIGAAAGAAIGYLLTTEKGQEVVGDLKTFLAEASEEVKETAKKFKSDIESAMEKGKKWADDFGKTEPSA